MSSRLLQEIRENRGLAYSVYSYLPTYIDAGLVVVYAGTNEGAFQEVIELVLKEFNRLKNEPLKNEELETEKEQLKGNLLLSLESSDNLMTRLAKNEIYFKSYLPVATIVKGIDRRSIIHQESGCKPDLLPMFVHRYDLHDPRCLNASRVLKSASCPSDKIVCLPLELGCQANKLPARHWPSVLPDKCARHRSRLSGRQ